MADDRRAGGDHLPVLQGIELKINRFGVALSILATAAVTLSACGSDNNASGGSATTRGSSANVSCGGKPTLKASGSTAQENAMTCFVEAFERACPRQSLTYTGNGSGAGISEFTGGQTDFDGSDSPLSKDEYAKAERRCGSPAWNLPMVFGPIAIAYNVNGLTSLNLDAPSAAKIFNGGITTWNDPAIQPLNSGIALPAKPIRVVFRSDESGTSDNFQRCLDTASGGAWGKGAGKTFNGGVAGQRRRRRGREERRRVDHLRRMVCSRPGATPEHSQGRHVGRSRPGSDQRGFGGEDDFRCLGTRGGQ